MAGKKNIEPWCEGMSGCKVEPVRLNSYTPRRRPNSNYEIIHHHGGCLIQQRSKAVPPGFLGCDFRDEAAASP